MNLLSIPWEMNEQGLWCPACGELVAGSEEIEEEGFESPHSCRTCGYPDFEDGVGYFTDE